MYHPWMSEAACTAIDVDPDLFFSTDIREIERAKEICAGCPVADLCLKYALDNDEREGIWSGLNGVQLGKLRRKNRVA